MAASPTSVRPAASASAITSARLAASRSPRLKPCPAIGCSACAALPTMASRGADVALRARQRERIRIPGADAQTAGRGGSRRRPAARRGTPRRAARAVARPPRACAIQTMPQRPSASGSTAIGPSAREALVGHVVVETLRRQRGDDRGLAVVPVLGRRCRPARESPTARRPRRRPACARDLERLAAALDARARVDRPSSSRARDLRRRNDLDAGHASQPFPERRADHAVGQRRSPAPRAPARRRRSRATPKRPCSETWIGGSGVASRCMSAPDAEALEDADGAVGQRRGALVETRVLPPLHGRHGLDQRDARARAARAPAPATRRPGRRRRWRGRSRQSSRSTVMSRVRRPTPSRARSRPACAAARRSAPRSRSARDRHVVLDAHADVPPALRHALACRPGCRCPARPSAPCRARSTRHSSPTL